MTTQIGLCAAVFGDLNLHSMLDAVAALPVDFLDLPTDSGREQRLAIEDGGWRRPCQRRLPRSKDAWCGTSTDCGWWAAAVPPGSPVLRQVSRWDETKGVLGVLESFTTSVARSHPDLHLVLLGPDPTAVADDPGGQAVFDAAMAHLLGAEEGVRSRVHRVRTSGSDLEGTAFIVNAVQQWADLISQKSLCEGFGLTVTEAKWKSKPVVAAAVGGIPSQLRDGDTGLLVTDSHDLTAFAAAVGALAGDDELRARLARRAHEDVAERFLFSRQLPDYLRVYESVLR